MSQKTTGWLIVVRKVSAVETSPWTALHPQTGWETYGKTKAKAREMMRTRLLQAQVSPDYIGTGKAERLYDE